MTTIDPVPGGESPTRRGAPWKLRCVETGAVYAGDDLRYRSDTGGVLDVEHDLWPLVGRLGFDEFDQRRASRHAWHRSGVWRFRELILPVHPSIIATRGEGNTGLYDAPKVAGYAGLGRLLLKHEGENPTGSFKDRGMTCGVTAARMHGFRRVACASTGNTSASMASYAALAGMEAVVFIPDGKISYSKLSQALAYGARTVQIAGNFDDAMRLVQELASPEEGEGGIYLLNSVNPFRLEGQKAIGYELLQDLSWRVPDWIVLPGGNLGNNSAIFKGLSELHCLGLIDRLPRIAVIQAEGASPLYELFCRMTDGRGADGRPVWREGAESMLLKPFAQVETVATAIRIGDPVSWRKSLRGLRETGGIVERVSDREILEAKAVVDAAGIGAEPASCATVAGARKLVAAGVIRPDEDVCGVLTGHVLKDPDAVAAYHQDRLAELGLDGIRPDRANAPVRAGATLEEIRAVIG